MKPFNRKNQIIKNVIEFTNQMCYFVDYFFPLNNGELCTLFDKLAFYFLFSPFIEKSYPPVCSTVPASLQVRSRRPRDCNKGQGREKREGDFSILGKKKNLFQLVKNTICVTLMDF